MIVCIVDNSAAPEHVHLAKTASGAFSYTSGHKVPGPLDANDLETLIDYEDYTTIFDPSVISQETDFSDHALMLRGFRFPKGTVVNLGLGMDRLVNLYAITKSARTQLDDYLHQNAHNIMSAVIVPFADSPVDKWVLALPGKGGTIDYDGPVVHASDWGQCIDTYMPRVAFKSISRTGNIVSIAFGLTTPDLQPVANLPWLFFETTAGVLLTQRSKFPSPCIVDVSNLPPGTEVRVKASFKHYFGLCDYSFTV